MIIYFFLSYRTSKDKIKQWLAWFLFKYGNLKVLSLLECIQYLGFKYVTTLGISLGLFDFSIPVSKVNILSSIRSFLKGYKDCLVKEKKVLFDNTPYILNWWNIADCLLKEELINNFRQTNPISPLYVMTVSGARGNLIQIKQIVSMRGIMINSFGEILTFPIKSNFKEGLNIFEYFVSCFGARKGVVDTSLKTSTAGYLTRKLVYVTQNIFIRSFSCNSNISFKLEVDLVNFFSYKLIKSKLIGRVVSKDIVNFEKGLLLVSKGQDLCYYTLKRIINNNIKVVFFKSPFSCELRFGLCQFCYGWNLVNGQLVEIGESIGILSAQSIGEPGTQLTMRTFHTGGVFTSEFSRMFVSPHKGKIIYTKDFIKPFFFPLLE